ncbi:serine/threonine-protein kinase [Amycolatopsis sp. YIM 10]|uniref:serine/threonine-protein kinase n=1 Tax=Amycolatopsis sp. YIM 10 TaxID=2653857 RepID=UPI00128FE0B7|nr:serine/threonine-protein kinase [Amycolatopsis sp. YIM 10]
MSSQGALIGGRYRLDQPIGRGRAGIVWMAYDTRLHRNVAAKRLYLPPGLDPQQAERARAVAVQQGHDATRISHACAITVHDVVRDGADVWLAMEYVPSRNMVDFLSEYGRLTAEQAAFLGVQLGSALIAAHAAGIPHRGLQPSNVLLADDGGVKLTDIGISGWLDPAYLSPEVRRGETPTTASDAYSLGATLFAAVEGVPPMGPDGAGPQVQPNHTGVLSGALSKMLRADPVTRPTVSDIITSLKAITDGRQTAFIPPTATALPEVTTPPPSQHGPPPIPPHQQTRIGEMAPVPQQAQRSAPSGDQIRRWVVMALAIFFAVAMGIAFTELFLL